MSKKLFVPLLVALAGCSGAHAASPEKAEPSEPIAVKTAVVGAVDVPLTLALDGTLEAKQRALVSPRVSGHVASVRVERGDVVEAGETLVQLRAVELKLAAKAAASRARAQLEQLGIQSPGESFDPDAVAEVSSAKADWAAKADQLRRLEMLAESGAVDDQTLEQAKSAETAARARYRAAREKTEAALTSHAALSAEAAMRQNDAQNATVRAPFAGSVVARRVDVGEYVTPQMSVVELVDASELRLPLMVPERYASDVRVGQQVAIHVDGSDAELRGEVRFVSAALDAQSRTLTVEAVAENPDGAVRAGHFARASIELDGRRRLQVVPASALVERAGVYRVYLAVGERAEARVVRLVELSGARAQIEPALPSDALVIVQPPRELADGSDIRPDAR